MFRVHSRCLASYIGLYRLVKEAVWPDIPRRSHEMEQAHAETIVRHDLTDIR